MWGRIVELGLDSPVGAMVDPHMCWEFVEFLPELEWHQAYVVLLLIRSKGLKEKYGFKGSDHSLSIHVVPGYYDDPRFKLYLVLRRYAVLMEYSSEYYVYERHTGDGVELYRIPSSLVALMVSPNPADWVRASVDTATEFINSLRDAMNNPAEAGRIVRRMDVRLGANAMGRTKRLFHMIDVDDMDVAREVEDKVVELLGYLPARIRTKRGEHILVKVADFSRDTAKRWFTVMPKFIKEINQGREEPVVEYKKNFQEPVPGVKYREIVPVFIPPEK